MIEKQFQSLKGCFRFYPECQFVQFILPCFVANLLDMDKDPSVSTDKKVNFITFVHELMKSYETHEYSTNLAADIRFKSFALATQPNMVVYKIVDWQKSVASHLKPLLGINMFELLRKDGLEFVTMVTNYCAPINDIACLWYSLPFYSLCRMQRSIEKIRCEKLEPTALQSWIHYLCSDPSDHPIGIQVGKILDILQIFRK